MHRFYKHVEVITETGCWIWMSRVEHGYGLYNLGKKKPMLAHRFSYALHDGELLRGYELHHKCEVRCCVNPDHLEQITRKEHNRIGNTPSAVFHRLGRCKRGHELTLDNTIHYPKTGRKFCRECTQMRDRQRLEKETPEQRAKRLAYHMKYNADRRLARKS